jgi:hypothetical protein
MGAFFTRERFGRPQVLAGLLLLVFLAQCVWLVARDLQAGSLDPDETSRIEEGLRQWRHEPDRVSIAGSNTKARGMQMWVPPELDGHQEWDPNHSPLWYLVASAPLLVWPGQLQPDSFHFWGWLARAPYLLFGVLLGASLWYVSRRLYGNAGGYIALTLYCFSPGTIRGSALWFSQPELGAAWGTFGAVFTAIAVTHTLYAPREVVLWNWRRIFLLGLSLALAVGSQFSLVIVVPVALGFMLYLAPARRVAAVAIWSAGCATALFLLFAAYFFHGDAFWRGMHHASFFSFSGKAFGMSGAYRRILAQLGQSSPALVFAIPVALITYVAWPRARYFGNKAPLLVAVLFLVMGLGTPHYPGLGFQLMAVPFLFVFVAGIAADLLETRQRSLALACVWGLLMTNAVWNLMELARAGRG